MLGFVSFRGGFCGSGGWMVIISIYCGWDYSLSLCFVRLFEYLHFWVCEVRLGFECWRSLHTPQPGHHVVCLRNLCSLLPYH